MAVTVSRRQVLGMGLGAAADSLIAPSRSGAADVLQKMVPDFTKPTGIQT